MSNSSTLLKTIFLVLSVSLAMGSSQDELKRLEMKRKEIDEKLKKLTGESTDGAHLSKEYITTHPMYPDMMYQITTDGEAKGGRLFGADDGDDISWDIYDDIMVSDEAEVPLYKEGDRVVFQRDWEYPQGVAKKGQTGQISDAYMYSGDVTLVLDGPGSDERRTVWLLSEFVESVLAPKPADYPVTKDDGHPDDWEALSPGDQAYISGYGNGETYFYNAKTQQVTKTGYTLSYLNHLLHIKKGYYDLPAGTIDAIDLPANGIPENHLLHIKDILDLLSENPEHFK